MQQRTKTNWLGRADNWLAGLARVSAAQKLFFIQQLGIMLKAGVPLARALEALAAQTVNRYFCGVITAVRERIMAGQGLAEALAAHPRVFDRLFVSMVRAGEASGTLESVLAQLYTQLKRSHQLAGRVRGALAYPAIVFLTMCLIGAGVMVFVVPKFISIFNQVEAELPLMTQLLIAFSNAITAHGPASVFVALVVGAALIFAGRTGRGRFWLGWLWLKLPVTGRIVQKIHLARFARTMSSLLHADIQVVEALTITADTLRNAHYRQSLHAAAAAVVKGADVRAALAGYPLLYNETVLQMVAVGEESGELNAVLHELARFYEAEVATVMDTLPTLLEPLIIILLAVGIGAMAVAIIMPMYELTNAF